MGAHVGFGEGAAEGGAEGGGAGELEELVAPEPGFVEVGEGAFAGDAISDGGDWEI